MLLVVKMRGSDHSVDMWEYTVAADGLKLGKPLRGYRALTSGIPGPWPPLPGATDPGPRDPDE